MSDISLLKTKQNQNDLKIQEPEMQYPQFGFRKPTSVVWGRFFTLFCSQFIFLHDRINCQRLKEISSCCISAFLVLSHLG